MYAKNLLYRAKAERSPIWLAAAFHVQYPTWTSQAPLVALSIHPVLNYLSWDFLHLEKSFFTLAQDLIPEELLSVKLLGLRAVMDVLTRPVEVHFGDTDAALLAHAGFLYEELPFVQLDGTTAIYKGYWATLPRPVSIPDLTFEGYLYGVEPEARHLHPNYLLAKVQAEMAALHINSYSFLNYHERPAAYAN